MTNATVERSDSQRSQGTGPRVSFNRDVHVKRIGARQPSTDYSHHHSYPNTSPQQNVHNAYAAPLRREHPTDLTENQIRKEAALVLAQASQVNCLADTNGRANSAKNRAKSDRKKDLPADRFNSLPNRKKNAPPKPVGRSSSDASAKSKTKRPSIFSLFSKKPTSDPLHTAEDTHGRRVTRSRSDVGSTPRPETSAIIRKRNNSETDESLVTKKKSVPLSPIIESPSRQSYFEDIPSASRTDLNMLSTKSAAANGGSPSNEMHSSQQPVDRLPLTKGVTVDGIVKHLSMERFSPVPHLQGSAFSYTRPNANQNYNNNHSDDRKIVYAHLVPGTAKEPSPKPYTTYGDTRSQSPVRAQLRSSLSPPKRRTTETNVAESPIVPVIREISYSTDPHIGSLSNRRQLLESRITARKIGSVEHLPYGQRHSGHRHESPSRPIDTDRLRSKSIGRDVSPVDHRDGVHQQDTQYSPLRSAMRSKSNEREQLIDESFDEMDGPVDQNYVTHQQSRFLNGGHTKRQPHIIDLGFIEDLGPSDPDDHYLQHQKYQERYRHEFEPNSLDSQVNDVVYAPRTTQMNAHRGEFEYPEQVHRTLRRGAKNAHNLARADSGIEPDYRRSLGDGFITSQRSSFSLLDKKRLTEQFLKRERLHSEQIQANRYSLMFRERSIDDGSLFDPRLDKYPVSTTRTLRRHQSTSPSRHVDHNGNHTSRSENKLGRGLEKVKQLFSGKKKSFTSPVSSVSEGRKEKSVLSVDKYGSDHSAAREVKPFPDIAMRRRLSTPKASPLPKRAPPTTSHSSTSVTSTTHNSFSPSARSNKHSQSTKPAQDASPQKKGWYKSLERLTSPSSAKSKSNINSHHVTSHKPVTRALGPRQLEPSPPAIRSAGSKLRFFGDTDLESNPPTISKGTSSLHRKRIPLANVNGTNTNHYMAGSHQHSQTLPRKHGSTLRAHSQEANIQSPPQLPPKPTKKDFKSSSKHLHDISESASDTEEVSATGFRPYLTEKRSRSSSAHRDGTGSNGSLQRRGRDSEVPAHYRSESSELDRQRGDRYSHSPGGTAYRKPPSGSHQFKSTSGSQTIDRRKTVSQERERIVDSSGTEGDSSQNSQRSVVYLHATTVGAIPQPHVLQTRRAKSRDELSSLKSSSIASPSTLLPSKVKPPLQPMTRTVSRSLSVLAPWTPKHIHDGYEINYSQQDNQLKTLPKQHRSKDYQHRSSPVTNRPTNNESFFNGTLPGQMRERDLRRETVSIPRR